MEPIPLILAEWEGFPAHLQTSCLLIGNRWLVQGFVTGSLVVWNVVGTDTDLPQVRPTPVLR